MVRNADDVKDLTKVSMSFIPSLHCNNSCSFCMYNASPENNTTLDYDLVKGFMKTVCWDKVCGWGLYGGEPSIEMELYQKFYELLPQGMRSFIITNGRWSLNLNDTNEFLEWCAGKFHVIVSGTPEHRKYQNVDLLFRFKETSDGFTYKYGDEEMHPMGRLAKPDWVCTNKCVWHQQVIRLGIFPTGDIILQNCDGVYPVVGHIEHTSFIDAFNEAVNIRSIGCDMKRTNVNDLTRDINIKRW